VVHSQQQPKWQPAYMIALLTAQTSAVRGEEEEAQQQAGGDAGMWLPPADQAGDGRTALNEKYGYSMRSTVTELWSGAMLIFFHDNKAC